MRKQLIAVVIAFGIGSSLVTLDAQGMFWTLINGRLQTKNPVAFTDGTAAAPSVTFASDTTNGLYKAATNQIGIAVAGTQWGRALMQGGAQPELWLVGDTARVGFGLSEDAFIQRDGAANTIAIKNSTNAQKFVLYQTTTGPVKNTLDMTAPTISSGFGTSPSIVAGGTAFSYRVNVGTGGVATSGVIGLPTATTGWNCTVQDMTNNTATRQTASTTSTATFTAAAAWAASDILVANCISY